MGVQLGRPVVLQFGQMNCPPVLPPAGTLVPPPPSEFVRTATVAGVATAADCGGLLSMRALQ